MLAAAGFEPAFQQSDFNDPALAVARRDVELLLAAHAPNPAMAIDRHWVILSVNTAVATLVAGAEPLLLRPPINLLRLFLHPAGLASRIVNLGPWRAHVITRLRRQIDATGDTGLSDLLEEIRDYPQLQNAPPSGRPTSDLGGAQCRAADAAMHAIATPLQLETIDGTLSFFCTTTSFEAAVDITLAEMTMAAFLPADQHTAEFFRHSAQRAAAPLAVVASRNKGGFTEDRRVATIA